MLEYVSWHHVMTQHWFGYSKLTGKAVTWSTMNIINLLKLSTLHDKRTNLEVCGQCIWTTWSFNPLCVCVCVCLELLGYSTSVLTRSNCNETISPGINKVFWLIDCLSTLILQVNVCLANCCCTHCRQAVLITVTVRPLQANDSLSFLLSSLACFVIAL